MEMQVVMGGVDIKKDEAFDQVIPVERAIVHDDYNEGPFAIHNDVGEMQRLKSFHHLVQMKLKHRNLLSSCVSGSSVLCFVPLLCSHATAESRQQTVLCQRNTFCKDGLPATPAVRQWDRVCDLRMG